MTDDMHPEVAAVLRQAQQLQSVMDEQLAKMSGESFTATDDEETVEVTLDGHHSLTDVFINDGLLRLGPEAVQDRINEALQKANAMAAESIAIDRERIDAAVAEITGITEPR